MIVAQCCSHIQVPTQLSEWIPLNKADLFANYKQGGRSGKKRVNEHSTKEGDSQIQE